jgi:hypothetical protein
MMEDLFDLLFTTFLAFFVLLFIMIALIGGVENQNKESLIDIKTSIKINDYLTEQKHLQLNDNILDKEIIEKKVKNIRGSGLTEEEFAKKVHENAQKRAGPR